MAQVIPFSLHKEREQKYMDLMRGLSRSAPPNRSEIEPTALLNLRVGQRLDARLLVGRTVRVYENRKLVGSIENCEIGDSTATVCFTLVKRSADGRIEQYIDITPNLELFVEKKNDGRSN